MEGKRQFSLSRLEAVIMQTGRLFDVDVVDGFTATLATLPCPGLPGDGHAIDGRKTGPGRGCHLCLLPCTGCSGQSRSDEGAHLRRRKEIKESAKLESIPQNPDKAPLKSCLFVLGVADPTERSL